MTSTNKRDGGEVELAIKWCVRQAGDPANAAGMVTLLAIAEMLDKQERALAESRAQEAESFQKYVDANEARIESEARAERLAGALRECRSDYDHALGLSESTYRQWCQSGAHGRMPNDTWPLHCHRRKQQIDAALEQEPQE